MSIKTFTFFLYLKACISVNVAYFAQLKLILNIHIYPFKPLPWYNRKVIEKAYKGGRLPLDRREGCLVTVFEALMLMLTFGTLLVALIALLFNKNK
uniref:putative holin-like toxin n=1 Tax=Paenibacillus sp. FSL H8-0537 TaxID=2921399 RepID=UPI00405466CB